MSARTLGRRASFWVATAVVAPTLWTSAAPSMTYRLYAAEWSLTHTMTTTMFAVFPIVVVSVLICFGDISDYIGRRTVDLGAIAIASLSVSAISLAISIGRGSPRQPFPQTWRRSLAERPRSGSFMTGTTRPLEKEPSCPLV